MKKTIILILFLILLFTTITISGKPSPIPIEFQPNITKFKTFTRNSYSKFFPNITEDDISLDLTKINNVVISENHIKIKHTRLGNSTKLIMSKRRFAEMLK